MLLNTVVRKALFLKNNGYILELAFFSILCKTFGSTRDVKEPRKQDQYQQ